MVFFGFGGEGCINFFGDRSNIKLLIGDWVIGIARSGSHWDFSFGGDSKLGWGTSVGDATVTVKCSLRISRLSRTLLNSDSSIGFGLGSAWSWTRLSITKGSVSGLTSAGSDLPAFLAGGPGLWYTFSATTSGSSYLDLLLQSVFKDFSLSSDVGSFSKVSIFSMLISRPEITSSYWPIS
jgi:hypothetical protein